MVDPNGIAELKDRIAGFQAEKFYVPRMLALYAATIATADTELMETALAAGQRHSVGRPLFYEIVLQSYLFLGFPRMLIAAEILDRTISAEKHRPVPEMVDEQELKHWYMNGLSLCKRIYGDSFESLKSKVEGLAPEVFRWMIIEGYGKVLSRPGLGLVERELANVAFLVVEDREQQLHSHMKGALNIGATPELLTTVIEDLGKAVGPGYDTAHRILAKLKVAR